MARKKTAQPVDSKQQQTDEDIVQAAVKRFTDWDHYAEGWRPKWNRDWKLRRNIRTKRAYKGVSDTFVAMSHGVVETMAAALGNGRPAFDYEPVYPMTELDTKPLNALVDTYWDADQWDIKVYQAIDQELGQGTAPVFLSWEMNRPHMENLGLEDAGYDPCLKSPMQLLNGEGYAFRRFLTTVDNLKTYEVVDTDPESKTYGEMVPRFKNLDQSTEALSGTGNTETDKATKEMFLGSTLPEADKRQVEVIEMWDADWVTCVMNRKGKPIERIENPYKAQHRAMLLQRYLAEAQEKLQLEADSLALDPMPAEGQDPYTQMFEQATKGAKARADREAKGIIPFAWARNYVDVSLWYGRSEIDPIADQQETLNDLTNQNVDAVTWGLLPERFLDPKYASWINRIGAAKPGRILPFPEGALTYAAPPTIPTNAFAERQNIKSEIREATAVDQVVKGVGAAGDATATEIRAQLNQAGQRIEIKARMLEKDFFFQIGTILWRMIQLYAREPVPVLVPSASGPVEDVYDPAKFAGLDLRPKVTLEITSQHKREQERTAATEAYKILVQDPTNNLTEVKKILLPKMFDLDPAQVEAISTPAPQPGIGPAMGAPIPQPGLPPEAMPMPEGVAA